MRSQAVLAAILATIAHLESIEAAPFVGTTETIGQVTVPYTGNHGPLEPPCRVDGGCTSQEEASLGKRSPINWLKIGEDGLDSLVSSASSTAGGDAVTAVENEAKSLYSEYARRSIGATVAKDAAKEGESLLDKAVGGAVSGGASAIGGGIVSGVEDLWDKVTGDDDSSSNSKRGWGSILGDVGKSLGKGALETGATDLWDDITGDDDSSSNSKRGWGSILGDVGKSLGKGALETGATDLWDDITGDDDSSSSSKRAVQASPKAGAGKAAAAAAHPSNKHGHKQKQHAATKTSHPKNARSFLSTAGKDLFKDAGKSALNGAAQQAGSGLMGTMSSEIDSVASDISSVFKERDVASSSETLHAPVARSSILSEIEHYGEEALPFVGKLATGLLEAEKRSTGTTDALAARSSILSEIENIGEDALPFVGSFLSDLKRSTETLNAPVARSSGIMSDVEEGLGDVVKYGAKYIPDLLEDI